MDTKDGEIRVDVSDSAIQYREVEFLTSSRSINNRLVLETYKKEGLKSAVTNGFAMIAQKVSVKGLIVLMDAKLSDGTFVPKGSTAYVREENLHTQQWAQKVLEADAVSSPFLLVDVGYVEFIVPPTYGPPTYRQSR